MKDINKEKKLKIHYCQYQSKSIENYISNKKCAVKIYSNGSTGTEFFTRIPYKNEIKKKLITNSHILEENEIQIIK